LHFSTRRDMDSLNTLYLPNPPNRKIYDFRSDTVTVPTTAMVNAMAKTEVGDDVKNEDPTVLKLQQLVASLCGKEDALFVCSAMMSNQISIRTHISNNYCKDVVYQEVLCDIRAHVYKYEMGAIAFLSGVQVKAVKPTNGHHLTAEVIKEDLFLGRNLHTPVTTVITLENTLNGQIFPLDEIRKIRALANQHDISMHLDGSRLWNACIASGIDMKEWCSHFDSITLCLSKGLGAPVGSVLVGSKSFIERARQYRKMLGGGWRQAGYMAMCGIFAIENHWSRMKNDHVLARLLYDGLIKLGFEGDSPETNMIFINSKKLNIPFETILEEMKSLQKKTKILVDAECFECRLVLHLQINRKAVEHLLYMWDTILKKKLATKKCL